MCVRAHARITVGTRAGSFIRGGGGPRSLETGSPEPWHGGPEETTGGISQKERRAALFIRLAHSTHFGPRPGSRCSGPPGSSALAVKYTDNNRNKKGLGFHSQLCPRPCGWALLRHHQVAAAPALLGMATVNSLDMHFISPHSMQDETWQERPWNCHLCRSPLSPAGPQEGAGVVLPGCLVRSPKGPGWGSGKVQIKW